MMNMDLTAEQQAWKEKIRTFVEEKVIPVAKQYDQIGEFPQPIIDEAAKIGLLRTVVPKEYGGPEIDALSYAILVEELGRGCSAVATTINGNGLSSYPVLIGGNSQQKEKWFKYLLDDKMASFALTEPAAGSDAGAVQTTAVLDGDEYIINGSKCFITTGGHASVFAVIATTDRTKKIKGLSAFIVEADREGISIGKHENKMGLCSSNTVEVLFRNVRIPKENLIGKEGDGFRLAMKTLDVGRINQASMAVGLSQYALEAVIDFVKTQQKGGKPLSKSQYFQFKVADIALAVEAARNMVQKACYLRDSGKPYSKEAAMTKTFCTDTAMKVASEAVDVLGIYGYMKESPVEKLMRDVKVMQIYEGTNQIQRIVIANNMLA